MNMVDIFFSFVDAEAKAITTARRKRDRFQIGYLRQES